MTSPHSAIFQEARLWFKDELEKDYFWVTARLTTLIDLLITGLSKYRVDSNRKNLIAVHNHCVKCLIGHRLNDPSKLLHEIKNKEINQNEIVQQVLMQYDKISEEIVCMTKITSATLSDEENYLKTLSNLDIDGFPIASIQNILICLLAERNDD
ncbi:MAG: hypothetical protein ACFB2Y_08655 [Fulvivirga sp.]